MNARQIIESLGGASVLAEILGYKQYQGQRRINNWKSRGIPAIILARHPKLFKKYTGLK